MNITPYGGGVAPPPGSILVLTTCQYPGEYAVVTSIPANASYQSTSTVTSDFITVRQGSSAGTVVAWGPQPLNWTSTIAGTYYIHYNTNAACGTTGITCRQTELKAMAAAAMAYGSSKATQANITPVNKCTLTDKVIIGVEVTMTGNTPPMNLTQFILRTNGTTLPMTSITNIKVYYTGNVPAFSPINLFGSAPPAASGVNIPVTGARALVFGTNYFWITYDLNAAVPPGTALDAQCTSLTVGGVVRTPTVTNPAGSRTVVVCPPSPGGVSSSLVLWLRPDAGITTSGSNVTAWSDQSVAGLATTVNGSPDLQASGRNYNPTVLFTMSNGSTGGDFVKTPDLNMRSFFCTGQLTNTSRESTHMITYDGVSNTLPCAGCAMHGGNNGSNIAEYAELGYGSAHFQTAGMWRRNGDATGVNYNSPHTGKFDLVSALGNGTGAVNTIWGGQNDLAPFNGRLRDWLGPVGDMILYSGPITTVEANRIETYLAIKYGITLGGNGSATLAYNAPSGTPVWAAASGYHNDVIGIGRDDATGLLQKQSRTVDDSVRVYLNTLASTNPLNTGSFANDAAYLMLGRNTDKVCATPASNLEKPPTLYSRLAREWKVQNTNFNGSFNFMVKLDACAIPTMVDPADLRLLVDLDGNFTNATVYAAGGGLTFAYASGYITVSGISTALIPPNAFRYITIGSNNQATPLPVELVAFTAECNDPVVDVRWTTASEQQSDHFIIQRSADGADFTPVAHVEALGTSVDMHQYSWTDQEPEPGLAYYRLLQLDINGESSMSDVAVADCAHEDDLVIFPNPAADGFSFAYRQDGLPLTVEVWNVSGQLVRTKTFYGTGNTLSRIDFDLDGLSDGLYQVRLTNARTDRSCKLFVLR